MESQKENNYYQKSSDFHHYYFMIWLTITSCLFSCSSASDIQQIQNNSVSTILLPDTGQTLSFSNTFGEDGDFLINPPSFMDNNNGTITDNFTGLMWQKTDGGEMIFENAVNYCATLNLGGKNDWRLPTSHELFDINDYSRINPALNTIYFSITQAEYWWTSDLRADDPAKVWVVNAGGGIGAHPKSETVSAGGTKRFHTRAVRGTYLYVINPVHFKDNGDGTITDNLTWLIWQRIPSTNQMTWEEALSYASTLKLGGKSGWRMPNIKELQSLNDEKLVKPSFNKNYFPTISPGNFWSSTSMQNSSSKAWDINVDYGIVSSNEKTVKEYVICVR